MEFIVENPLRKDEIIVGGKKMELNELQQKKKQLEEELKEIEIETKKAEEQIQIKKTIAKKFPPNVILINSNTIKRLIREIQRKHDEKTNQIEIWARGKMINKAFFIACCDSVKKLYAYKETMPSLDKVQDRKKKGEMFDIATVKIILRLEV